MATHLATVSPAATRIGLPRLWRREFEYYPDFGPRLVSLSIVVLTTMLFYYQYYVISSVSDSLFQDTGMSFLYFVGINVVSVVASALTSIAAGVTDRYGRANLITVGLLGCALVCLFGLGNAHTELSVAVWYTVLGALEGVVLVATPALVRDFSPQLGRASAMGFWTLGPVIGSLVSTAVVSATAGHLHAWQDQYVISGLAGLAVFLLALFGLRELSPALRDQIMVSERDRVLVETRAKGLDVDSALRNPIRQMLRLDVLGSAVAISLFLFVYFIAASFFPLFFQTTYGYSESTANALGTWMWSFQAGALIVVGLLSDLFRVRKPFMLIGGIGAIVSTILFIHLTTHPHTGYYTFALAVSLLGVFLGMGFAPWMASYTETVEERNPALTATGLSVWGFTIRLIAGLAIFLGPALVTTVNTLVNDGPRVQAAVAGKDPALTATQNAAVKTVAADPAIAGRVQTLAARYRAQLATAAKISPATQNALAATPTNPAVQVRAVSEISGQSVSNVRKVIALSARYKSELAAANTIDSSTQLALLGSTSDPAVRRKAVAEIAAGLKITPAMAAARLQALAKVPTSDLLFLSGSAGPVSTAANRLQALAAVPAADLAYLNKYGKPLQSAKVQAALRYLQHAGPKVQKAVADSPGQWRTYLWIAVGGEAAFLPLIFLMTGYWDPRKARRRAHEHAERVSAELAALVEADQVPSG